MVQELETLRALLGQAEEEQLTLKHRVALLEQTLERSEREAAREVSGLWWVFLVTGIIWFIISLVVLRFDETSIDTVGIIIGVVFAVGCVNEFMTMAIQRGWRWVHALLGILFGLGAIWCFVQPEEAFWALASVLGFLLIFKGAADIIVSTMTREYNSLWGLGLAAGIEEDPRAIACDDDAAAEPLPRLVVERVRAQTLADAEAVRLVVQVDLNTPFVLHRTR